MRKFVGVLATVAVVSGLALAAPGAQPASAISAGVHFSADDLPTWQANGVVWGIGHANGRVVAGGTFSQIRPPEGGSGTTRNLNALAIFDAETGAPDSCQLPAALTNGTPTVRAVTTSPDGNTVYVGGNFSSIGGVNVNRIAAIDPVACTVKPFRVSAVSSFVYGIAVTEDTVYFGGAFTSVASQPRERFAAVDATTGALRPWVANVELAGRAVTVSPDRTKVAIGGDFFTVNGEASHSIGVVDAVTGANLRNYPEGFIHRSSVTKSLASDGTAFYAGNEGTGGGVFDGSFSIDWNTLDERWRNTCLGATQAVLPYEGTLYEASHRHHCGSINEFQDGRRMFFTAAPTDTPRLLGWFPEANDGIGEGIGPRALTVATGRTTGDKFLWAGGEFTVINGEAQQSLTRFGTTDTGAPPVPAVTAEAVSPGAIQVSMRSVVDQDDSELVYSVFRNGASTPIWTGTATSKWWVRPQVTFVDTDVTAGTSYSYRVRVSDGTNTSALSAAASAQPISEASDYVGQVIADDPALYWRYDEPTGVWAKDKSGNTTTAGLNGIYEDSVLRSAPGAIAGDPSTAGTFDGVEVSRKADYVWNDQLRPGPNSYTIETWFKTNTTSGGKLVGYGNGRPRTDNGYTQPSSSYDRHVYMENSGRIRFGVYTGSAQSLRTAAAYNDNQWHHLVATQGPSGMVLYVDGEQVGQNSVTQAEQYLGSWRVGGDNLNSWPDRPTSRYFAGQIDETAIYDYPLSVRQVVKHYSAGGGDVEFNVAPSDAYGASVFDNSPSLYWRLEETSGSVANDSSFLGQQDGAIGSLVQKGQPGLVNGGLAARTTGSEFSAIASPQVGAPAQFSAEGWFKTGTTSGGKLLGFENAATGSGTNYDKQVYMTNSGTLIFGIYNSGFRLVRTSDAYNDNQWHHFVAAQDGSGMRLYVDGALTGSNGTTVNQSFSGYWRIGGGNLNNWPDQPSTSYFTGDLDEIAIYPHGLSTADVAAHYALGTNDSQAPTVPQDVQAAIVDGAADVSWTASTDNNAVTGYRVHRGDSAGFTVSDENKIADMTGTAYTDSSIAFGTYFYRIVAVDGAGNASDASADAQVSMDDTEAPSTPQDLSASVSGSSANLEWAASTDNAAVVGYEVHRGATAGFAAGASSKIADVTGTGYTDSGLAEGTYYYRVVAVDAAGNTSAASDSVSATIESEPVEPVVLTVNPSEDAMVYRIVPDNNTGAETQLSSRGDAGNSPIESYLKFALPEAPVGTVLSEATLRVRTSNDSSAASADAHTFRIVTGGWSESTVTWNTRPTGLGATLGTLSGASARNTDYAVTLNAAELSGLLGTTASFAMVSTGGDNLRISSKDSSNASYRPALVLNYTPGSPPEPDTTAPSAPTDLAATVSGSSAALSWTASSDDRGVAGYRVHRGASADFAVGSSSKIADVAGTEYTDSGLAEGTYFYRVVAGDAAGNTSAASGSASAAIEAAPAEPAVKTVLTAYPTEDAMAYRIVPDNNTGAENQLSSRADGGNSPIESYLKFVLPKAPAGTVLTEATLRVRTSNDSSAASGDVHTFRVVTGEWSESTVTWNTRPTGPGAELGTLTGATARNTDYVVGFDAATLRPLGGTTASVAMFSGAGSDNVRIWSKDSAEAYRPQLTLTYTPE